MFDNLKQGNTAMSIYKQCPKCNINHSMNGRFCSRSCANSRGPRSDETRAKISKSVKANPSGCILDQTKAHRPIPKYQKIAAVCICCNKEFTKIENSTKKYCSSTCYHKSGNCGGYKPGTTGKKATEYEGIMYDSGTEAKFAKLLTEAKIEFIRNTETYFIYNETNKYYPDFYLPTYKAWVEIKGRYYYNDLIDPLKWSSVENLYIVWHDDLHVPNFGDPTGTQTPFSR